MELAALTPNDFERILTEPDASLTEQYQALLATENLNITFTAKGIAKIAQTAWEVNERTENIGARRLHTVMERLLEEVSFNAADTDTEKSDDLVIDEEYVEKQLGELAKNEDLSRFIL